jgi:hypothetical protein
MYDNISKFLENMKKTINLKTDKPYIGKDICIIKISRENEIIYNINAQQFSNIEYFIFSINECIKNNARYIAMPLIFSYPNINHATGIFIDFVKKKIEYFDSLIHELYVYNFIPILENHLGKYFPQYKWLHKLKFIDINKKDNFLQETIDVWGGACVIYTTMYLTMRCIYPKMSLNHMKHYFNNGSKSLSDKQNILKKFANFIHKTNFAKQVQHDISYFKH